MCSQKTSWIPQFCSIVLQCFYLLICPLPEKALNHVVTVSAFQKSAWEFVETPVSLPSFPLSATQFCLSEHTFFFYNCYFSWMCPQLRRVWTNDLSPFVMCLKGMGYKCLLQRGPAHMECSFFKYLCFCGGISKHIWCFNQKDVSNLQTNRNILFVIFMLLINVRSMTSQFLQRSLPRVQCYKSCLVLVYL